MPIWKFGTVLQCPDHCIDVKMSKIHLLLTTNGSKCITELDTGYLLQGLDGATSGCEQLDTKGILVQVSGELT